jgi:hypothetical protein
VSTNALDARATATPDFYSSLEYLVAPIPATIAEQSDSGVHAAEPGSDPGNDVNNSLQKLTNLVYLLTEQCRADEQSRTTLTLMQAELAHLSVLVRRNETMRTVERRPE